MAVPYFRVESRAIQGTINTRPGNRRPRCGPDWLPSWRERRKDLSAILETARESDGYRPRCKNCGSCIPRVAKLKLSDILAVIRELRAILPAQLEHEGLPPIQVNVVAGGPVVPYRPDEE